MTIIKNSVLNVLGYLLPGIISIPVLGYTARVLGVEQFGYFSIILSVVGYASIFDIGITRSIIREVAIYRENNTELLKIISTSLITVLCLGILASMLVSIFSSSITSSLKVNPAFFHNFVTGIIISSICIPLFLITQVWISVLEGKEQFLQLNIYKTISGTATVLLPAFFLFCKTSFISAIIGLLASRIFALLLILFYTKEYKIQIKFYTDVFKRLINFGGWIAISNIISPIMSYFDRFILSNRLGSSLVGYYTAPSEAVAKISILPNAVARTIFPILSNQRTEKSNVKKTAYFIILLCLLPISGFFAYFAYDILSIWLGVEYAEKSTVIFQVLIFGLLVNSLAQVPFSSIQAKGKSNVTAYIHLIELIPYLMLLFYMIKNYGLVGAAWAWTIRVTFDLIALIFLDKRFKFES